MIFMEETTEGGWRIEDNEKVGDRTRSLSLKAKIGESVVGRAVCKLDVPKDGVVFADISTLYVDKGERGRGIGSELLERSEDWAKLNKAKQISIAITPNKSSVEEVVGMLQKNSYDTSGDIAFKSLT